MDDLETRFARRVAEEGLSGRRTRLLLGVSGGVDSMVLLHLMQTVLAGRRRLGVVHVNHGLRGRSSGADERFVHGVVERLGLPFFVHRPPVRRIARSAGVSLEMAAREARHRAFVATAKEWGCRELALAHHRDDQIELFLLRLLRGAGAGGLGGMETRSRSPFSPGLMLLRPLLEFDRSEIEAFARARKIRFREDASNQDEDIPRNRLRRRVIPLLREMQPALGDVMGRSLELLRAEHAATAGAVELWLSGNREQPFADLPLAWRRQVVRAQLFEAGVVPDFDLVETLVREPEGPVNGPDGTRWELTAEGVLRAVRGGGHEFLAARSSLPIADLPLAGEFAGGRYDLRHGERPVRLRVKTPGDGECFDADPLGEQLILRHWQPGDRYRPIGMKGTVKLQDAFVNAGVPRQERHTRAILTSAAGEIVWVEGLRIADSAKVTRTTRRFLRWRWRRD